MAGTLKLDSTMLVDLGHHLRAVATEFDAAQHNADYLATAAGHEALAEKIKDFASVWDDKRAEMLDAIASLADAAKGAGEQYEQLDNDLAQALLGQI